MCNLTHILVLQVLHVTALNSQDSNLFFGCIRKCFFFINDHIIGNQINGKNIVNIDSKKFQTVLIHNKNTTYAYIKNNNIEKKTLTTRIHDNSRKIKNNHIQYPAKFIIKNRLKTGINAQIANIWSEYFATRYNQDVINR